jgi:hypothetical protein
MLAVWVQKTVADTPAEADALVTRHAADGVTDIFYYNGYTSNYAALAYLTTAAHKAGLRVHAWLCFGADLYGLNSAWKCSGVAFTNFGIEAARVKMAAIVSAILQAVPDIDGFHLDYMRSPTIDSTAHYTADAVTDAVERIAEASEGKMLSVAVKAYKDDWNRWAQNWPAWLNDSLVDLVIPMCYHPLRSDTDTAYHVQSWVATNAPMWLVVPGLAVIDTSTTGEPLKTATQMANEAALFVKLGFGDVALFDNRATDAQIAAVAAELPEDEPDATAEELLTEIQEDMMGVKDTILSEAEKLKEQAAALLLIAASLRAQAGALETADTKADELAALL